MVLDVVFMFNEVIKISISPVGFFSGTTHFSYNVAHNLYLSLSLDLNYCIASTLNPNSILYVSQKCDNLCCIRHIDVSKHEKNTYDVCLKLQPSRNGNGTTRTAKRIRPSITCEY